jgi:hypothetical protein
MIKVLNLLMKRQIVHVRTDRFSRAGAKPHYLDPCAIDFVCKLVHSDVGRSANKYFAHLLLYKMVH